MRVLVGCSMGGQGHLRPLLPLARAAQALGHDVKLLVPPSLEASAAETALEYVVGAQPPAAAVDALWDQHQSMPAGAAAGFLDRELFAKLCTPAMLPTAERLLDGWSPELVVREPCEYSTAVVAHRAGIRQAQVGISLARIEMAVTEMVTPILESFEVGTSQAITRSPYLSSFPPSLDPSEWPDTHRFGLTIAANHSGSRLPERNQRPLVYMTMGTVFGRLEQAKDVYRLLIEAVSTLEVDAVVTVGRATSPSLLEPFPSNVRVAEWIDQNEILASAAVAVCHGGSGTTYGALAHGVPVVMLPSFADQHRNAKVVSDAGAGITVPGGRDGAGHDLEVVRDAISTVLVDPRFSVVAAQVATEMAALQSVESLVTELLDR